MQKPTRFVLGAATVSLFHIGMLHVRLAEWLSLDQSGWPAQYDRLFDQPIGVPIQSVHIGLPGRSVLIDPCHPELLAYVGEAVAGVAAAPSLLAQFGTAGLDPLSVDTVVITHPHFDHYCGTIAFGASAENDRLLFPNARHLLGRADWETLQAELMSNPAGPESRCLGLAQRAGLLDPVDGLRQLGDGLQIVPTPGETVGHQALRLDSQGAVLYCAGDLYHHAVEVERPDWGVYWAEPVATARSREAITTAALAERALLIAGHIAGVGRLERVGLGLRWEASATS